MADYIDRNKAINALEYNNKVFHYADSDKENIVLETVDKLCQVLCEMPAADVQPMKHGRWVDCTFYDPYEKSYEQNFEYRCSCCGHMIYNKPNDDNLFCGHCSARMDLKDGDTE